MPRAVKEHPPPNDPPEANRGRRHESERARVAAGGVCPAGAHRKRAEASNEEATTTNLRARVAAGVGAVWGHRERAEASGQEPGQPPPPQICELASRRVAYAPRGPIGNGPRPPTRRRPDQRTRCLSAKREFACARSPRKLERPVSAGPRGAYATRRDPRTPRPTTYSINQPQPPSSSAASSPQHRPHSSPDGDAAFSSSRPRESRDPAPASSTR